MDAYRASAASCLFDSPRGRTFLGGTFKTLPLARNKSASIKNHISPCISQALAMCIILPRGPVDKL